jgi:hypothetical protein
MTPLKLGQNVENHCGIKSWKKHNATPIEDGSLGFGVSITSIIDEGINSMWWKWVLCTSP